MTDTRETAPKLGWFRRAVLVVLGTLVVTFYLLSGSTHASLGVDATHELQLDGPGWGDSTYVYGQRLVLFGLVLAALGGWAVTGVWTVLRGRRSWLLVVAAAIQLPTHAAIYLYTENEIPVQWAFVVALLVLPGILLSTAWNTVRRCSTG